MGIDNITESKVGASKIKELKKTQCLIHDNKSYKYSDKFVKGKQFLKTERTGFLQLTKFLINN